MVSGIATIRLANERPDASHYRFWPTASRGYNRQVISDPAIQILVDGLDGSLDRLGEPCKLFAFRTSGGLECSVAIDRG